jgi:hypothetical protein
VGTCNFTDVLQNFGVQIHSNILGSVFFKSSHVSPASSTPVDETDKEENITDQTLVPNCGYETMSSTTIGAVERDNQSSPDDFEIDKEEFNDKDLVDSSDDEERKKNNRLRSKKRKASPSSFDLLENPSSDSHDEVDEEDIEDASIASTNETTIPVQKTQKSNSKKKARKIDALEEELTVQHDYFDDEIQPFVPLSIGDDVFPKNELVPLSVLPPPEDPKKFTDELKYFDTAKAESHNNAVLCFGLHSLVVQQLELDDRIQRFAASYVQYCHRVKKTMNIINFIHTMNVIGDLIICATFDRLQEMREELLDESESKMKGSA